MGANNSSLTPLNCILKNWERFDHQSFKKTHLIFLCETAWPQYSLEDGKQWPVGGSLKYNTVLLQLDRFCRKQGKWIEVAYILPFFSLWDKPDLHPKGIDLGMKLSAPYSALWSYFERSDAYPGTETNSWLKKIEFGGKLLPMEMNGLVINQ